MLTHTSLTYNDGTLSLDGVPLTTIAEGADTPAYVYSLPRVRENLRRLREAFPGAQVHYSLKANANLAVLRALVAAGAGMDAVSAGEIHRALRAGAPPETIVFAGAGKTAADLRYAVAQGVGWVNVENAGELDVLESSAAQQRTFVRVALRLNPDVTPDTQAQIATEQAKSKFGLNAREVRALLARQRAYPHLRFEGLHVHIGSQLHSVSATRAAVGTALELIAHYDAIRTLNIGGGLPVPYAADEALPAWQTFARAVLPLLRGYDVLLEPGRALVADAGVLLTRVLYRKRHFVIVDAGMNDLLRPALYDAHHTIVPVRDSDGTREALTVVGPVCETTDVLGTRVLLPPLRHGDLLVVLTAGAYGMTMASTYNQRPRPPEIVTESGTWRVARRRETLDDLLLWEAEES